MSLDLSEIPTGVQLSYNPHGGAIVRQSDLSSWARCALQKWYQVRAGGDPEMPQPEILSATAYGTVIHYALLILEQRHHEGGEDPVAQAVSTFEHYWHPDNIEQVAARVTRWLPRQTYGGLRERGRKTLRDYYKILCKDPDTLLGLEYQFAVPIAIGTGTDRRIHTLTGTIDKLTLSHYRSKPYIKIADWKSGRQQTFLRYNTQGTAYAYATTREEFWSGWNESGCPQFPTFDPATLAGLEKLFASHSYQLHEWHDVAFSLASRRFRWLNMTELKDVDGGWRTDRDYARLKIAIDAYVRANEAGIYSPTNTGEVCTFCAFRGICGGIGLPDEDAGAPA